MSVQDDDAADRVFEQRARAELRRGVEAAPPELREKLDRLVDAALSQSRKPRLIRFALPAAALAIVATVLVTRQWQGTHAPAAPTSEDVALLLNADLDMLEQMEFYQWLEQHPGVLEDAANSGSAQRS